MFRDTTEENLRNKIFYPDDRKYIVRVLATMMLTTGTRATTSDCDHVAKALIRKFPFLKEYVSVNAYCLCFIKCFCNSNLGPNTFM